MRKKQIIGLSVVLSIALIGLIMTQASYFLTAYQFREAQFKYAVKISMAAIVDDVDKEDKLLIDNVIERKRQYMDSMPQNGITESYYLDTSSMSSLSVSIGGLATSSSLGIRMNDIRKHKLLPSSGGNRQLSLSRELNINFSVDYASHETSFVDRAKNIRWNDIIATNLKKNEVAENFEYAVKFGERYIVLSDNFYNVPSDNDNVFRRSFMLSNSGEEAELCVIFPNMKHSVWSTVGMVFPSVLITVIIVLCCVFCLFEIVKEKHLSSIKNDFINNMTHEFKTPIASIYLASQMMKDGAISLTHEKILRIAGIVFDESKRLTMLVEKVLQTALFSENRMRLKKKKFSLNEVVRELVEKFAFRVEECGGTINTHLEAERDVVYADDVHIVNVVSNLLDNAIKYCSAKPVISIYTRNIGSDVVISVVDNGIGIAAKDKKMIFERFYRVSTGNLHDVKGFGLGLSYVKTIVEAHGGRVDVESQEGKGSRFDVYLPLMRIHKKVVN